MRNTKRIGGTIGRLLTILLLVATSQPMVSAHPTDSSRVELRVETMHFFQNNEYFNLRQVGYTLPGFYLRPHIAWQLKGGHSMEVGAHWLHYWGATTYPTAIANRPWPNVADSIGRTSHVLPWMRLDIAISQHMRLTMGSLHSEEAHGLPLPLYSPERHYATDPEAGVQLRGRWSWGEVNAWVDWRKYIWMHSQQQEQFLAGLTACGRLDLGNGWALRLPMHGLALHTGGQGLATPMPVNTQFNLAAAVGAEKQVGSWRIEAACYAMSYRQQKAIEVPYLHGEAIYPTLRVNYHNRISMDMGYWQSEHFVSLLGSPLFGDMPFSSADTLPSRTQMFNIGLHYSWHGPHGLDLKVVGRYGHFINEKKPSQYSFGLTVGLQPTLCLWRQH